MYQIHMAYVSLDYMARSNYFTSNSCQVDINNLSLLYCDNWKLAASIKIITQNIRMKQKRRMFHAHHERVLAQK
jgi:hypothetical protein